MQTSRPYRLMVNVDEQTRDMIRAFAFSGNCSQSFVASEMLRLLVPAYAPVAEAVSEIREAPAAALAKLSSHAEQVAEMARQVVDEARSLSHPPAK